MTFKIESSDTKDIVCVSAEGEISASDYQEVLLPVLEKFRASGSKARILIHFGSEFKGYTASGAWEDAKLGLRYMRVLERCAVVSDLSWIKTMAHFVGSLIPCSVNTYSNDQLLEAKKWLDSGDIGLEHQLDRKAGIVNIEISAPITSINMEILSHTVDGYIEEKGKLNGLVIHAEEFPGWKDLGSMISHLMFVKNHHEKISRVALVIDSALINVAEAVGKHFLEAQIKHFDYSELDEANKWVRS